jgi:hypothetical protein
MKTAKGDDKNLLAEQAAALEALLADVAVKHVAKLAERPDSRKSDSPHGPWAAHFRSSNRELDALPAWQSGMTDLRQRAASHEKLVAAAIAKLEKTGGASFSEGAKAFEDGFLAQSHDDLGARLAKLLDKKPKGVRAEDLARFKSLGDARKPEADQGLEAATAISREAAEAFRRQHPTWFE